MDCDSVQCPGYFRCQSSSVCLHHSHLCDGWPQCPLEDDEFLCSATCPVGCHCVGLAVICHANAQEIRTQPLRTNGSSIVDNHDARKPSHTTPTSSHLINLLTTSSTFQSLRYLDVSGHNFSLSTVQRLPYLIFLKVTGAKLETLPTLDIPNLQTLDISNNNFALIYTSALSRLTNLKHLRLSHNPLIDFIDDPAVYKLRNIAIVSLNLSHTSFETIGGSDMKYFKHLSTLDLSFSDITNMKQDGFSVLDKLHSINIKGLKFIHIFITFYHQQQIIQQ